MMNMPRIIENIYKRTQFYNFLVKKMDLEHKIRKKSVWHKYANFAVDIP
jgi:hypothetical protein